MHDARRSRRLLSRACAAACILPPLLLTQLTYKEGALSGQASIRGAYVNTASKASAVVCWGGGPLCGRAC